MTENTTATAAETADKAPTPADVAPAQEHTTDWKAEARKWEARAKENSTAAKKLAEMEDAEKTELQRLTDRLAAAETALTASRAEALRNRVLAEHAIPADYADLVTGDDEDALTASAKKVHTLLQTQAEAAGEPPARERYVIDTEGADTGGAAPLNSDAITDALKGALGIK